MAWYKHATNFTVNTSATTATITQLDTAWATWEAAPEVHWQRASSSLVAPAYLVLKRKDGSPGRIIFTAGTAPATNYVGYNSSGVASYLYLGYDPITTDDTPGDYSVNGGALFTGGNLGRLQPLAGYTGSYNFRLYANAAADIIMMHGPGGSQNDMMWGALCRSDDGTALQGYLVAMQPSPPTSTWRPCISLSSSYGTTSNLVGQNQLWVYDTLANEGAGSAWTLLMDTNTSSSFHFDQGNYSLAFDLFARPNGIRRFAPAYFVPCIQSAFARPSFSTCTSRYWGYGAPNVLDATWLDNASNVRGYYIGYTASPSTDRNNLSLINETF